MELAVGKVVGKLSQGRWGQVHDFNPEDEQKITTRGRLVAAVSLAVGDDGGQVQMVAFGREALSRLQELYYGEIEKPAMEQLKKTAVVMGEEFPEGQIAAAAIVGGNVYVATGGGAGVWVSSGTGKQGWLVKPGLVQTEGGVSGFSGKMTPGTVMVLGTRGFWSVVSERLLVSVVTKAESNFLEAVEMVVSEAQSGEEGGGAGVVLKIQEPATQAKYLGTEKNEEPKREVKPESKIKAGWLGLMKRLAGKVYIKPGDKQEQRRKMMIIGMVFMAILLLFFGWGQIRNQEKQELGSERTKVIEKIRNDFEEAKALSALNPTRSRELLAGIKQAMEGLEEGKKSETLETVNSEWQQVWDEAAGITQIQTQELLDLGLVRDDMEGSRMVKSEEVLVVLDQLSGRVAEINTKTGAGKVIAGGDELAGAKGIAVYPGRILVLGSDAIWEVTGGNVQSIIKEETVTTAIEAQMWAGNIYVLTGGNGGLEIRRYQAAGEGFGEGQPWLADETKITIPDGAGMAIDGSIWLAGGAEIYKFTRGVKDNFGTSGWDEPPQKIDGIYTDENAQNLYIWEKDKARVVVVNKEGEYQKQYKGDILGRAADLVFDEEGETGYILADGKVWQMSL